MQSCCATAIYFRMEKTLNLMDKSKGTPRKRTEVLLCIETGESATIAQWAETYAARRGVTEKNARTNFYRIDAMLKKQDQVRMFGVTWTVGAR